MSELHVLAISKFSSFLPPPQLPRSLWKFPAENFVVLITSPLSTYDLSAGFQLNLKGARSTQLPHPVPPNTGPNSIVQCLLQWVVEALCREILLPPDVRKTAGLIHSLWQLFHPQDRHCLCSLACDAAFQVGQLLGIRVYNMEGRCVSSRNTRLGRQQNPKANNPHKNLSLFFLN